MHEAQLHERNCFVTLTYDDAHLPADLSVDVRHWQLFAKRLRKRVGPFRFLHCGEYGEESLRPHYHALLFGVDFADDKVEWKMDSAGRKTYLSALLTDVWSQGFTTVGDLTWQSAAYVARYVMKKVTGAEAAEHYTRIDGSTGETWQVRPEYSTMSRRPGLGAGWFEKFKRDVYPDDFVVVDGRKFRPPVFYDRRLPPEELEALKERRAERGRAFSDDKTPERLLVREKVAEGRTRVLRRGL